jgi:toxin ParE1/3/4
VSLGLLIKPKAEEDLAEAYDWYEEQRIGLGDELLLCVESAIESARRNPELFPAVRRDVRRALTRRFPYGVFYVVESDRIVVLAIYHSSRDPRGWQRRIPPGSAEQDADVTE